MVRKGQGLGVPGDHAFAVIAVGDYVPGAGGNAGGGEEIFVSDLGIADVVAVRGQGDGFAAYIADSGTWGETAGVGDDGQIRMGIVNHHYLSRGTKVAKHEDSGQYKQQLAGKTFHSKPSL